jgi:hypothetical protein
MDQHRGVAGGIARHEIQNPQEGGRGSDDTEILE